MTQKDSGTSLATSRWAIRSDTRSLEVESPEKDDDDEVSTGLGTPRRAVDLTWRDEVAPILESFTRRTPGSALETTDARLCWYFRDADPDTDPAGEEFRCGLGSLHLIWGRSSSTP